MAGPRQTLSERKVIERVKGIVMEQLGLGEAEARSCLEQEAQRQGISLAQMAEGVITTRRLIDAHPKSGILGFWYL